MRACYFDFNWGHPNLYYFLIEKVCSADPHVASNVRYITFPLRRNTLLTPCKQGAVHFSPRRTAKQCRAPGEGAAFYQIGPGWGRGLLLVRPCVVVPDGVAGVFIAFRIFICGSQIHVRATQQGAFHLNLKDVDGGLNIFLHCSLSVCSVYLTMNFLPPWM